MSYSLLFSINIKASSIFNYKGNFSSGSDADIAIYYKSKADIEEMFAHPSMVIKGGQIVVENGKIKKYTWGKTQTVKPEYDKTIEKNLKKFFDKYHTIKLENYIISDEEMSEYIGSSIATNNCKYSRKN